MGRDTELIFWTVIAFVFLIAFWLFFANLEQFIPQLWPYDSNPRPK